jgi:hypothetical protein
MKPLTESQALEAELTGTNYYAKGLRLRGLGADVHLGKSAVGWVFALRVYPDRQIKSLDDWKSQLAQPGVKIRDEYGRQFTLAEFLEVVTGREWNGKPPPEWYWRENKAVPGPNKLARFDPSMVYARGEGTWDCIARSFS